jgi:small conductance mechanosensitive channel
MCRVVEIWFYFAHETKPAILNLDPTALLQLISELTVKFGTKVLAAIAVIAAGLWVVGKLVRGFRLIMQKRDVDATLRPFLTGLVRTVLRVLVILTAISILGIEMTSFVAIIGSVGIAFGLALSGTLQNFAGGVVILILKPFKVGDYVEAMSYSGSVKEIQIFNTFLTTPDNKVIILPNGPLSSSSMINYSRETMRRVDITVSIAYGDDFDRAKSALMEIITEEPRILKDPVPFVGLNVLAASSVDLAVRVWVKPDDYWDVYFQLNENIYKILPQKGLNFPFPQMDVHLYNN